MEKANQQAASPISRRSSGHNQPMRCVPPIGIEQWGRPRCVQMTLCTLVHHLSRSSDCQMRAAVRSSRLYPSTSSFRTRPSRDVFRRSSAPSSMPRCNLLATHNLLNPLASPIITPRSFCVAMYSCTHEPNNSRTSTSATSLRIPFRVFMRHAPLSFPFHVFHVPLHR